MKRAIVFLCYALVGCSQALNIGNSEAINAAANYSCPSGTNVMTVTVNGSLCTADQYVNEPCASVTICAVGSTATCQTINNILVDTGSFGLRIFSSLINSSVLNGFTNVTTTNPVAAQTGECVEFGSGRTWGRVMTADVYLAGEPYSRVPIQLISSSYSGGDSQSGVNCSGSDVSPSTTGYNGILGVGLFDTDCGANCTGATPDPQYFACNGTTCSGISSVACNALSGGCGASAATQVENPVAHFNGSTDTNGLVFLTAPANSSGNAASNGCVIFGVNTETNNVPSVGTNLYPSSAADAQMTMKIGTRNYADSFLDSGSNALYLDPSISIPECSGWYCPSGVLTETFTANSVSSNFFIANADTLFNTGNSIFNDLGGSGFTGTIDLGIPFFYGRAVWVGISGKSTTSFSNASGPYWAY